MTHGWHQDRLTVELGYEAPGPPEPDGLVETASRLVNSYQFSDPRILRAAFHHPGDLGGRDMLLEGRFLFLRFVLGVRVTAPHNHRRHGPNGPEQVIGWSYQTLQGHLEQGRLTYDIAKEVDSGRIEFRIRAFSRRAPIPNPVLRLGFRLFGRGIQARFYRNALRRLTEQVQDPPATPQPGPDGIVRAPSGAGPGRFEGLVLRFSHPGR